MRIDLRKVPVYYINLEEHKENRKAIPEMLQASGFSSVTRTPGIRVTGYEGNAYHQPINHFMGVGLAQLNAMRQVANHSGGLILEDDIEITTDFQPIIEVPDNTDAVYLGVSSAGNAFGYKVSDTFARIFNVLTTHAILYVSEPFIQAAIEATLTCLFRQQAPLDMATANLQSKYNVVTPLRPFFYQADKRESANKWEYLTNRPLRIYEKAPNNQYTV